MTRQDSWSASGNCLSSHRGNAQAPNYARFYSFTLEVAAEVTIDLSSSADTYLYLLSGHGTSSTVSHYNDDAPGTLDSRLSVQLTAGNYTIEATTFSPRTEGSFTLTVATDIETSETVAATVDGLAATYNATVDGLFSLSFSFEPSTATPSVQSVSPTGLNLRFGHSSDTVWAGGTPTHAGTYAVVFAFTQPGRVDTHSTTVNVACPTGHTQQNDRSCEAPAVEISGFDDTSRSGAGSMSESFFVSPADASCSAWRSSGIIGHRGDGLLDRQRYDSPGVEC